MNNEERGYVVALHEVDGLGPQQLPILLKYFGSARKAWRASGEELARVGVRRDVVQHMLEKRRQLDPSLHLKTLAAMGVTVITVFDDDYPKLLAEVKGRPVVLYVKGNLELEDARAVAVVGTRKPTLYGREVTAKLVTELTAAGVTIVSGLARGIDSVAHRAALDTGGRTIAVMATGIDSVYPPENKELASKIIEHGALVSEFPPGYMAVPGNFPARNRIISGLSLGVVVTEGAAKSGTKITAQHALDQGREVFAVPGPVTSIMSEAPVELLRLGAKVTTSGQDILEELKIDNGKLTMIKRREDLVFENELEEVVYGALAEQAHIDEVARKLEAAAAEVSAALTMMEIRGIVKHLGGMVYCRA